MIEIPEMLNLIEIAVSERGENFRYADYDIDERIDTTSCAYTHPISGEPLCIAAVALSEAGLLDSLKEGDIVSNQPRLVGRVSKDALDVLRAAQAVQDVGVPWGEALADAQQRALELTS